MQTVSRYFTRPNAKTIFVMFLLISCAALALPQYAYAFGIDDVTDWLKDTILKPWIETMLNSGSSMLSAVGTDNLLTGSFGSLFSSGTSKDAVWGVINKVHQTLVVPVGHSILAAAVLVQLVKISQKVDANATLPTVKEIFILVVFFVVFTYMINHGPQICQGLYDAINDITKGITSSQKMEGEIKLGNTDNADVAVMLLCAITASFIFCTSMLAAVVAYVMAAARALQLYVMAVFSPIPFALLGFEETRNMGINYIKVFASVCLAGAILAFLIAIFPILYKQLVGSGALLGESGLDASVLIKSLAIPILAILGMVKSGSWARDILGG